MNEKKNPKKPLIYYYLIVLVLVMILNATLFPRLMQATVKEVQYSEFIRMLDEGAVDEVQVSDMEIAFTPKEKGEVSYYVTGKMEDDRLVDRLEAADVAYGRVVPDEEIGRAHA